MTDRTHHHVSITTPIEDGEHTFPCTLCKQQIRLMVPLVPDRAYSISLHDEDASDPEFGTVDVTWVTP